MGDELPFWAILGVACLVGMVAFAAGSKSGYSEMCEQWKGAEAVVIEGECRQLKKESADGGR